MEKSSAKRPVEGATFDPASPLADHLALYQRLEWYLFPVHTIRADGSCSCGNLNCKSPGKHPMTRNGLKGARREPNWFKKRWDEGANIGVATGNCSGILVIDVDPRHGGDASLRALEERHGPLPPTWRFRTGGGGEHILFRYPKPDTYEDIIFEEGEGGYRNSVGCLGDGLDVRANGGYIVAPPSAHPSGGFYEIIPEFHPDAVPLADLPEWLLKRLPRGEPLPVLTPADISDMAITDKEMEAARAWATREIDRLCAEVSDLREGERNAGVFARAAAAGNIAWALAGGIEQARERLEGEAGALGLERGEAARAVRNGLEKGSQYCDIPEEVLISRLKAADANTYDTLLSLGCSEDEARRISDDMPPWPSDEEMRRWTFNYANAGGGLSKGGGSGASQAGGSPLWRGDHSGHARAFLSARLPTLRRWRGEFYCWDGVSYRVLGKEEMDREVWGFLDGVKCLSPGGKNNPNGMVARYLPNIESVANVRKALSTVCALPDDLEAPAWLTIRSNNPPAREFVPAQNGLLHLPSGELWEPSPDYFAFTPSGCAFRPEATCPQWLKFLGDQWADDPLSIEALQEWTGYLLSRDTDLQKILLVLGPSGSGKGTIGRVWAALFGKDNVAAVTLDSLGHRFGLHGLVGKSVAIDHDARLSGKADHANISANLLSVSGEDSVNVQRKGKEDLYIRLPTRLVFFANLSFALSDAAGALVKRLVILRMTKTFRGTEREDTRLEGKLLDELPGILNWAMEGYRRLRDRGRFVQPESAQEDVRLQKALGSPAREFVETKCIMGDGKQVTSDELFMAYLNWCAEMRNENPWSRNIFFRNLRAEYPDLVQVRLGDGERSRGYRGIAVWT